MTKEELAEKINGRQYRDELPKELHKLAKKEGLFVINGASDDICQVGGLGDTEVSCFDGGDIVFCKDGDCENVEFIADEDDENRRKKLLKAKKAKNIVKAVWCDGDWPWTYKTKIPHSTFQIWEGDDKYCIGIVFSVKDIK